MLRAETIPYISSKSLYTGHNLASNLDDVSLQMFLSMWEFGGAEFGEVDLL